MRESASSPYRKQQQHLVEGVHALLIQRVVVVLHAQSQHLLLVVTVVTAGLFRDSTVARLGS